MANLRRLNASPSARTRPVEQAADFEAIAAPTAGLIIKTHVVRFECVVAHFT
jgi:hypothetical protein